MKTYKEALEFAAAEGQASRRKGGSWAAGFDKYSECLMFIYNVKQPKLWKDYVNASLELEKKM